MQKGNIEDRSRGNKGRDGVGRRRWVVAKRDRHRAPREVDSRLTDSERTSRKGTGRRC